MNFVEQFHLLVNDEILRREFSLAIFKAVEKEGKATMSHVVDKLWNFTSAFGEEMYITKKAQSPCTASRNAKTSCLDQISETIRFAWGPEKCEGKSLESFDIFVHRLLSTLSSGFDDILNGRVKQYHRDGSTGTRADTEHILEKQMSLPCIHSSCHVGFSEEHTRRKIGCQSPGSYVTTPIIDKDKSTETGEYIEVYVYEQLPIYEARQSSEMFSNGEVFAGLYSNMGYTKSDRNSLRDIVPDTIGLDIRTFDIIHINLHLPARHVSITFLGDSVRISAQERVFAIYRMDGKTKSYRLVESIRSKFLNKICIRDAKMGDYYVTPFLVSSKPRCAHGSRMNVIVKAELII